MNPSVRRRGVRTRYDVMSPPATPHAASTRIDLPGWSSASTSLQYAPRQSPTTTGRGVSLRMTTLL